MRENTYLKKYLNLMGIFIALTISACGGGGGPSASYIAGTITGTLASSGLTISNGAETISVNSGSTQFQFSTPVASGTAYEVTVLSDPDAGVCAVSGTTGVGTANGSAVNVIVDCLADGPNGEATAAEEALLTNEPRAPNPDAPYATEPIGNAADTTQTAVAIRPVLSAVTVPTPVNPTAISGTVTFSRVFQTNSATCSQGAGGCGLNFASPVTLPARYVRVEAVSAADGTTLLAATNTDGSGNYSLNVSQGASVLIRLYSQIQSTANKNYQFTVVDNTSNNAIYVLQYNQTVVANSSASGINILAPLGYDSSGGVIGPRASAPFSILDDLSNFSDALITAGGTSVSTLFSTKPLVINWSVNNVPSDGDKTKGFISTSNYDGQSLNILGKADNDTDEFDIAVMGHEWGHWMQSIMSNSDNPGGNHASGEIKDYSLAYGEGWGTGFSSGLIKAANIAAYNSAGITGYYYDTSGKNSATGSSTNMTAMPAGPTGAFNENAVAYAIYQIMNQNSGGLSAFVSTIQDMRNEAWGATIIGFAGSYYKTTSGNSAAVSAMLSNLSAINVNFSSSMPDGFGSNFIDNRINAASSAQTTGLLSLNTAVPSSDFSQLYVPISVGSSASASFTNAFKWGGASSNGLGMTRRWVAAVNPSATYRICATGSGVDGQTVFWLVRGVSNYLYWSSTSNPTANCSTFTTASTEVVGAKIAIALQYDATTIKSIDSPVTVTMVQL